MGPPIIFRGSGALRRYLHFYIVASIMTKAKATKSRGNVFIDLGFPPEEAMLLTMRSDLMAQLRLLIERNEWTQAKAAKELEVTQSRVSDLMRGKWDKFSLDMLLILAARAGLQPKLKLSKAA
jgi:predicted XRE-type DNA-binding protein